MIALPWIDCTALELFVSTIRFASSPLKLFVALYCWLRWPDSFRKAVEDAILAGDNTGFSGSATVAANSRLALYSDTGSTLNSLGACPGVTVQDSGALYVTVPGAFAQSLTLTGLGFAGDALGALRAGNIALPANANEIAVGEGETLSSRVFQ